MFIPTETFQNNMEAINNKVSMISCGCIKSHKVSLARVLVLPPCSKVVNTLWRFNYVSSLSSATCYFCYLLFLYLYFLYSSTSCSSGNGVDRDTPPRNVNPIWDKMKKSLSLLQYWHLVDCCIFSNACESYQPVPNEVYQRSVLHRKLT